MDFHFITNQNHNTLGAQFEKHIMVTFLCSHIVVFFLGDCF